MDDVQDIAREARMRLVDMGGRTGQDLGVGRILGQVLVYLYLWKTECSLDQIEEDLGLSKAAVSVAVRQLESLGFARRIWKQGDRRAYYRTADNLGQALQGGLIDLVRRKMDAAMADLEQVQELIGPHKDDHEGDLRFLHGRVKRAKTLAHRANLILNSKILRSLVK